MEVQYLASNLTVNFEENSTILFYSNNAFTNGGSIYSENKSAVIIMGYSKVIVNASLAYNGDGGAVYSNDNSKFISKGSSKLTFIGNHAMQGGAIILHFCQLIYCI